MYKTLFCSKTFQEEVCYCAFLVIFSVIRYYIYKILILKFLKMYVMYYILISLCVHC